jgi:hypothetical protein
MAQPSSVSVLYFIRDVIDACSATDFCIGDILFPVHFKNATEAAPFEPSISLDRCLGQEGFILPDTLQSVEGLCCLSNSGGDLFFKVAVG